MVVIFLILALLLLPEVKPKSAKFEVKPANFGNYTLDFSNYTVCRGPKAKNLTEITVVLKKHDNGTYELFKNMTFLKDVTIKEIKASVYKTEHGIKRNLLYTYRIDPCNHFFLAEMTRQLLNSSNCHIKKGIYYINLDMSHPVRAFFGTNFYYGEYLLHTVATTKQGNIFCFKFLLSVQRKRTTIN